MPVPFTGREPDHIALGDLLDRAAFALDPSAAEGDDQRLTRRMGVPGGAGTGFEGDMRTARRGPETRPGTVDRFGRFR